MKSLNTNDYLKVKKMRRYASIDFLRGLAIVMMVVLHVFMYVLDQNLISDITTLPVINIIAFITLVVAGGCAGFFLLVSAIGNMISMQRNYESGKDPRAVAMKQIIGGLLLLVFAVLTEGVIGYQGALGNLVKADPNWWKVIYYRGYHFETIHTIAWCVIVNGFVQWALASKKGWQKVSRNIKMYIILAIIVVVVTPLIWYLVELIIPGYPYATWGIQPDPNREIKFPLEGVSGFWDYVLKFFLAPLASSVEPIFPYLAISFLGSIIGMLMAMKHEQIPRKFPGILMRVGYSMFLVGVVGFLSCFLIMIMNPTAYGFANDPIEVLKSIILLYDHRWWTTGIGWAHAPAITWLFQFLFLNGIGLCLSILIIRMVEFRGKGATFAKQTLWVRRYGFAAFSIYNYQFLYFLPWFIVTITLQMAGIPVENYGTRGNLDWLGSFIVLGMALLLFEFVLRYWEKIDFAFGLEWCIGVMAAKLLPVKKQTSGEGGRRKWWQVLDAKGSLRDVEWLNIVEEADIPHKNLSDSRLAYRIAIGGFFLFPASFMALAIARSSFRTEQANKYNKRARILAIAGIIFFILWFVLANILSLANLGLA